MTLSSGTRLGPYQVIGPLGAGGMGEVYRARDTRLGRDVAIKVLRQHEVASSEDRARFRREAKAISSLNHPHICVLHDIGQEGDTDYLVMELVEGETLGRRIAKGPLPTADVLRLGAQIADALSRAHRAGVVHRDLKPGNVMLTKGGAKLMDFGLAREFKPEGQDEATVTQPGSGPESEESITRQGMVVGTFQYMAPEQLEGKRADARSDIWALGCVLYEMATGKRAFEGSTPVSVISAIMRDEPRRMSELTPLTPPALEQLVRACLMKDAEDRLQTAHDAKLQLQWIAEGGSRAGVSSILSKRRDRERVVWGLAGSVLLLGVAALFALWRVDQDKVERFSFTPLTYKPMTIFRSAFAPDGATVAFSAASEGDTPRVFVVRPEYPEPQPVSDPGTHLLSISSRGELAVLTETRYQIFPWFTGTLARMPLGGGAPHEVLHGVHDADWSPDGAQLAIMRGVDGKDRLEFPTGRVLYEKSTGYLSDPRFSPKGDRIAFFDHPAMGDPGGSLNVVNLAGKRTVVSAGYDGLAGIAWSRDGSEIFFSGARGGGEEAVYAATMAGSVRIRLQSPGGLTIHDVGRTGRWLITRDDVRNSVMVHKPEWKEDRDLSWLDCSVQGLLSRDASFLVFNEQSGAVGGKATVCLRKTDGSPVARIGGGFNCTLSPNGKWVITRTGSPPTILTLQPTGVGEPRRLARGDIETYNHAWWFPNGDSILIRGQEHGKAFRLYVQDLTGGLPHALTQEKLFQAAIAPDGSWVMAKGGAGCFLYRFDGSVPQPVPWLRPNDQLLPWVVDGRSVLVIVGPWRQVPIHIERVDRLTGHRTFFREISPMNQPGVLECNLTDFSADFNSYAYDATSVFSSLFLVQHEKDLHPR